MTTLYSITEYNVNANYCYECPWGSSGAYPNCICADGGPFEDGYCKTCPWNANGTYAECECQGNASYDKESNYCYECPEKR